MDFPPVAPIFQRHSILSHLSTLNHQKQVRNKQKKKEERKKIGRPESLPIVGQNNIASYFNPAKSNFANPSPQHASLPLVT
jgi:hypothetical protein